VEVNNLDDDTKAKLEDFLEATENRRILDGELRFFFCYRNLKDLKGELNGDEMTATLV
jgi:hypothetical protein